MLTCWPSPPSFIRALCYFHSWAQSRVGSHFWVQPRGGSRSWVMPNEGSIPKVSLKSPESHKCPLLPPSSDVVWQPLCSPSAHHQYGASSAGHPPLSPWLEFPLSPPRSPGLRLEALDSASAHRPSSSTMAHSSLHSAVAWQSTGSAGLPRPSGSALV